jgi:hypothetical protein
MWFIDPQYRADNDIPLPKGGHIWRGDFISLSDGRDETRLRLYVNGIEENPNEPKWGKERYSHGYHDGLMSLPYNWEPIHILRTDHAEDQ